MRRIILLALCGLAAVSAGPPRQPPSRDYSFHHLHLNDSGPQFLIDYYQRLFDPASTRRTRVGGADGLQSGPMLLLVSRLSKVGEDVTALWHFGWGVVSLGETYLAHARREVAWEAPLPADRLHLHVRSVTPSVAAAWYRDVLGARVSMASDIKALGGELPPPEHRFPEALIWIGDTGLLIYRTEPPLLSTRGQRVDHFALLCSDLDTTLTDLRRKGVRLLAEPTVTDDLRSAMVEGPDQLAIELVETR